MKKEKIYELALFYQHKIRGIGKEKPLEFSFSDARYFRDTFSKIEEKAQVIEKDRSEIINSKKSNKKKAEELRKLSSETIVGIELERNIIPRLEKSGVTLTIDELKLFE